jgi:hypothetical protein
MRFRSESVAFFRSDVGQNGTRSDATSFSGALYASLRLFDPLFADAALGYGTLGYDNHRFVTATVRSSRERARVPISSVRWRRAWNRVATR